MIVRDILCTHLPEGAKTWVFGSRVLWTTKDSSDLDLAIEGEKPFHHRVMGALEDAFEESDLPFTVDVVDMSGISSGFRKIIEAQKVRFPGQLRNVHLSEMTDLILSSVDKKTKANEHTVLLCNYTDVYKNRFINGGMSFMTATATEREIAKCKLKAGDVVITKDSEKHDDIGVPALIRDDIPNLVCGYHLAILRPMRSKLDGKYLYYALSTANAQEQFHSYTNGVTRFGLRKADIGLVQIPLPALAEQRKIAGILGTLDDKIELNRRMNETLEAMARALFKSWFVDFEPVRAKMEGHWRRGESLPGFPAELYDLFPDTLVDSELGEIPEGWEVKPLDSIASFLNGLALQKYPTKGGPTLPVIKIAQLRAGQTTGADLASADLPKQYIVQDGDVLFSWSGSLLLDLWTGGSGALNQHLFKVTSEKFPKWFYYYWIQRYLSEFRDIAADKATTMGHIQRRHLHDALTIVPGTSVLKAMNRSMQPLMDRSLAFKLGSRSAADQRDKLLPMLVTGKIQVNS